MLGTHCTSIPPRQSHLSACCRYQSVRGRWETAAKVVVFGRLTMGVYTAAWNVLCPGGLIHQPRFMAEHSEQQCTHPWSDGQRQPLLPLSPSYRAHFDTGNKQRGCFATGVSTYSVYPTFHPSCTQHLTHDIGDGNDHYHVVSLPKVPLARKYQSISSR